MAKSNLTPEQVEIAKALRMQGVTYDDIAVKFGVTPESLRVRASRDKWKSAVTQALAMTTQIVTGKLADRLTTEIDSCAAAALELSKGFQESLRKKAGKRLNPRDLVACAQALDTLDTVRRRALGMSERPVNQINIGIVDYGSVSQGGQTSSPEPADQTIDIE